VHGQLDRLERLEDVSRLAFPSRIAHARHEPHVAPPAISQFPGSFHALRPIECAGSGEALDALPAGAAEKLINRDAK
jgi:hypothetical protein